MLGRQKATFLPTMELNGANAPFHLIPPVQSQAKYTQKIAKFDSALARFALGMEVRPLIYLHWQL